MSGRTTAPSLAAAIAQIQCAARAKARRARRQLVLQADRELAASLRYACWLREGCEGPAPACADWQATLGGAFAEAGVDELLERARALMRAGYAVAGLACSELLQVAEARQVH